MVLDIGDRVAGKDPYALAVDEPCLFTVAAHRLHIAVGHGPIKQKFFCRLPMIHLIHIIVCFN